jgi:hypothetical protein
MAPGAPSARWRACSWAAASNAAPRRRCSCHSQSTSPTPAAPAARSERFILVSCESGSSVPSTTTVPKSSMPLEGPLAAPPRIVEALEQRGRSGGWFRLIAACMCVRLRDRAVDADTSRNYDDTEVRLALAVTRTTWDSSRYYLDSRLCTNYLPDHLVALLSFSLKTNE